MAEDVVVGITLTADNQGFRGEMRLSQQELERFGRGSREASEAVRQSGRQAERASTNYEDLRETWVGAGSQAQVLLRAVQALGVGLGIREVIQYADTWRSAGNALRVVQGETGNVAGTTQQLFEIAQRTRTEFSANVQLFQRLSIAAQELGRDQADLLRFTEGVGQAIAVSGGNAQDASGALLQLSQAIGGTVVRAEEFTSILEGAPRIARAVADGLDAAGGSVAQLRTLVNEGAVSSRDFFDAFLSQLPQLQEEFERTEATVGQALTVLNNAVGAWIAGADEATSATSTLAQGIIALADNFETVADGAVALGTAVAAIGLGRVSSSAAAAARNLAVYDIASRRVSASMTAAAVAARGLNAALALAGGPAGLALLAAGAMASLSQRTNEAEAATQAEIAASRQLQQELASGQKMSRETAQQKLDEAETRRANALQTIAEIEAQVALNRSVVEGMPRPGPTEDATSDRLAQLREQARLAADSVAALRKRLEESGDSPDDLGAAAEASSGKVGELAQSVANLREQLAAFGDGGEAGLERLEATRAFQEAQAILADLSDEDLPAVRAALDAAGISGDTLADRLARLILRENEHSEALKAKVKALRDEQRAQKDATEARQELQQSLERELATARERLRIAALDERSRRIEERLLEVTNRARERGIELTDAEIAAKRRLIAETVDLETQAERTREAIERQAETGQETADVLRGVYEEVGRSIQRTVSDVIVDGLEGDLDSVADIMDRFKAIVFRAFADIAAAGISQNFLLPAVGQVLGAAGASLGGTGGAQGGLDPTGGALGDALGLGRSLGADLVPGGFGGINSAINGFGANLGFASGAGGGTLGASAGAPGFIGPNTSGLFGSTTLSGFLGGAGAGFGAGSFANSLVGGEGGQVGSGIGAAGGAAIGSVVPGIGTLAGGLIGGGLGGLISGLFGGGGKDFNLETAPTIDGLTAGAGRRETPFGFIAVQESGISGREFERGLTGQIAPLDQRVAQRLSASEIEAVRAAFAEGNGVNVDVGKEIDQSEIAQAIGDRFVTIFDAINAEVPDFLAKAARTGKEGNEEALEDALDEAFGILDFRAEFDARVRELTTGRPDSERLTEQVQQQIDNELTAIDNFLANVREAFPETITRTREAEVTVERVVNGRTGETREVTDTRTVKEDVDTSAESERRLAEAREASRAVLERLLGIRESETESVSGLARQQQRLEAVLARVQDPTSDLRETMDRLGVSASAAEASVAEQIAATEDRRAASLRLEAEGLSRVGDRVLAVSQGLDALRTEADAVGVSAETVADVIDRRFDAALSGVSRDQIPALIDVFEVLEGSIPGLDAALAELGERATEAAGAVSEATAESRRRAALLALEADGLRGAGARAVELAAGATRLADALATGQIDATQMAAILERRVGGALDLTATEAGALEQALAPLASDVPGLSTILDTLGVAVTEASDAVAQAAQRFRAAQQDAQQDIAQIGVDRTGIEAARDSGISRVREAGGSPAATQLLERLAGTTNTTTAQDVLDDISDFVGSAPSRSTFGSRLRAELEAVGATFDGDQAQVTLPNDDGGTTTASVDLSRSAQDIAAFLGQFDGLGDFDLPRLGGSEGVFAALSGAAARIFDAIEAVEAASARGAAERAAAQRREEARLAQTQVSNPDLFGSPKIDTRITAAGLRDTAVADVLSEINGSLDVEVARDFAAEILDVADSGDTAASAIGVLTDVLAASGQAAQTAAADFDRRAQAAQRAANSDIFGDSLTRQVVARGLDGGAFDGVLREAIAAAQDGDLDRDSAGRIGAVIQSIADSAEEAAPVLEVLSSALAESERVARERERAIADATQSRIREIEDATQAEVRAREDAVAAWRRATESLDRGLTRLRFDESVSPLGPTGRMEALRQEFEDTAQRALAGDPEAAAALETLSVDYLQDFREFSGDFGAFKAENERVRGILERVRDNAQQQITAEERQITEIEASAERQITAIEAASERQIAATEAAADRQAEAIAEALDRLGRPGLGDAARPETSGGSVEPIGIEEARARLSPVASDIDAADTGGDIRVQPIEADDGRNAFALLDSSGATLAVGGGPADTFSPAALAETAGLDPDRLQGFESGGMTPGGGEVVRIHNDELLFTGPPSRVFNAAESERLLSGGDNDTIVAAAERTTVAVGRVAALLGEANARLAALEERVGRQGEAIDNLRRASGQTNRLLEKRAA